MNLNGATLVSHSALYDSSSVLTQKRASLTCRTVMQGQFFFLSKSKSMFSLPYNSITISLPTHQSKIDYLVALQLNVVCFPFLHYNSTRQGKQSYELMEAAVTISTISSCVIQTERIKCHSSAYIFYTFMCLGGHLSVFFHFISWCRW